MFTTLSMKCSIFFSPNAIVRVTSYEHFNELPFNLSLIFTGSTFVCGLSLIAHMKSGDMQSSWDAESQHNAIYFNVCHHS